MMSSIEKLFFTVDEVEEVEWIKTGEGLVDIIRRSRLRIKS